MMKHQGKTKSLRRGLKKRVWQRSLVGALACAVLFCTLSALSLPAITGDNAEYSLENGALLEAVDPSGIGELQEKESQDGSSSENEPGQSSEEENAAPLPDGEEQNEASPAEEAFSSDAYETALGAADAPAESDSGAGDVCSVSDDAVPVTPLSKMNYSSELEDFVVGVEIRDGDGNVIPPSGTIYPGESYSVSITFSENDLDGEEKQFQYNGKGYLTYHIPPVFTCSPASDEALKDASGNYVGSYSIDASGLIRVRFVNGHIDALKASMSITLSATASRAKETGIQSIDFGGYIIAVNVSGDEPSGAEVLADTPENPEKGNDSKKTDTSRGAPSKGLLRSIAVFSSELEDFVVGVEIRDGDGNVIPPNGTVYIGESYSISIAFSENNISGQEKQFAYNEDGYLTYHIPAAFVCSPVSDGVFTDSNGDIVGSYSIDADGLLRVRFVDGYIDSSMTSMNITLNATVNSSAGPTSQPIDFGGYIIEVFVSGAGQLEIEKRVGSYDPRTHSIGYEVEVRARNGTLENVVYTDTPTSSGLTIDPASVRYYSLDGLTEYTELPTTLHSGEGFRVRYRAVLDPSVYQGVNYVNYTAKNTAGVTGTNSEGPVSAQDSTSTRIKSYFLQKSGSDDPTNSRIHWTVYVGDGSTVVDGLTLTDLPGSGLDFVTGEGIKVTPYTYTADGELTAGASFTMPFGTPASQITLPTGQNAYKYRLTYFTSYTLPAGETSHEYENTVSTSDPEHGPVTYTGTATGHEIGVPPDILKQVEKSADGTALHYTVDVQVPGYYGGTSGFYLVDSCNKVYHEAVEYYFGQNVENLTIWTETALGDTHDYVPYTGGSTDYTYLIRRSSDYRVFYLYFNTNRTSYDYSNWIETEDATLHISYDLPLSTQLYNDNGSSYVPADGVTLGVLVEAELFIKNRARLYYSEGVVYVQSDAQYREVSDSPIRKTGTVNEHGVIEYQVVFNNRDADWNTILQKKMKELVFHDELMDGSMNYVDGSLFCDIYNDDMTRIRATYQYSLPISGASPLAASSADFVWYSGDYSYYTTLYQLAQHSPIGGAGNSTSRLVFRYQVQVDTTHPTFATTDLTVPLSNQARLTGIMQNNSPFDSGPADCTINYDTEIVKKEIEHAEGSNRADFIITLNPLGIDLLDGVTQMAVLDRMTPNLQPVLRTIKVYQKLGGVWEEVTPQYTYDADENVLTFTLPDNIPIQITYTTLITETGEGVSIGNSIVLDGYAEYSAVIDAEFKVDDTGGAAQAGNFKFTLLKQSADLLQPLSGAVFALYGPEHSERQGTPPTGTPATLEAGGQTLWYYTSYVTGADGTVDIETNEHGLAMFSLQGLYALKEISAPEGYVAIDSPICFYADARPTGGLPGIDVLLSDSPITVQNEPLVFQLPNTGGIGVKPLYVFGAITLLTAFLWFCFREKVSE